VAATAAATAASAGLHELQTHALRIDHEHGPVRSPPHRARRHRPLRARPGGEQPREDLFDVVDLQGEMQDPGLRRSVRVSHLDQLDAPMRAAEPARRAARAGAVADFHRKTEDAVEGLGARDVGGADGDVVHQRISPTRRK